VFNHDINDPTMEEVAASHTVDGEKEPPQHYVEANLNHTEQVHVNSDVDINVHTNGEKNVDPNMEHLDEILLEKVEDNSDGEEMTYIRIHDKIKNIVDPFKNTQAWQSSKSQP